MLSSGVGGLRDEAVTALGKPLKSAIISSVRFEKFIFEQEYLGNRRHRLVKS